MELLPEAQAVTEGMAAPLHLKRMAIIPAAIFAIIIGMK